MRFKRTLVLTFAVAMFTVFGGALASRTSSTAAAPVAAASAYVGTWQTTWKAADGRTVSAPIIVKADMENANALDGIVNVKGADGAMYGRLSPDGQTWSGHWWNQDGQKGTFKFTLRGKKNFNGSYTIDGTTGDFEWNGNK
jgi:hypothetical protein